MDDERFSQLLNGALPSLDDFAGFVSVLEKLPDELLWKVVSCSPNLHPVLRSTGIKRLQEVIPRKNVDNALNAIVTKLALDWKHG